MKELRKRGQLHITTRVNYSKLLRHVVSLQRQYDQARIAALGQPPAPSATTALPLSDTAAAKTIVLTKRITRKTEQSNCHIKVRNAAE
jgi:hypothetical protein